MLCWNSLKFNWEPISGIGPIGPCFTTLALFFSGSGGFAYVTDLRIIRTFPPLALAGLQNKHSETIPRRSFMAKSDTAGEAARPWQSYHTVYTNAKAGTLPFQIPIDTRQKRFYKYEKFRALFFERRFFQFNWKYWYWKRNSYANLVLF